MTFTRRPDCEYSDGAITGVQQGLHCHVQLNDGRELVAVLPKSYLRRLGCIFGDLAGYRVTIAHRANSKPPVIIDMRRPPDLAEPDA